MLTPKSLFTTFSAMMLLALTYSIFATPGGGVQAAQAGVFKSTPGFYQFHHNFSATTLAHASLPHWSSSFRSEGKTWTYTMVGSNPARGSKTTTIPVTIIPLLMQFSDGKSFDGSREVSAATTSPLFQNAPFISGTTQYGDADMRAEFWDRIQKKSPNYHVLVGTPTIANTLTMSIPAADGATATDPSSGITIGLVSTSWLDTQLQALLISMHFSPNMLPIFLSYNVFATLGAPKLSNCCYGGYHNAVNNQVGMQTYIWSTATDEGVQGGFSEDVGSLSHEILEWLNDPFGNNVVPLWMSPLIQRLNCSNLLEVGDPLIGVLFTVSGFSSDHLQDVAFFSWFARQKPSRAINGLYTYLGTFNGLSNKC
ncbi:MAG TPA: hypothetical protein VKV20_07905 [Ktedonobacteraceae bacterium]|nr:hypothetical protein [Ktedonobacteraceae bacterium]